MRLQHDVEPKPETESEVPDDERQENGLRRLRELLLVTGRKSHPGAGRTEGRAETVHVDPNSAAVPA